MDQSPSLSDSRVDALVSEDGARGVRPPARADLKLVVIIPCLNEEKTVARVVGDVPSEVPGVVEVVVVVIDDGSSDATADTARSAGAEVIVHHENQGLGMTFRRGVHAALAHGADVIVNVDGDGQFESADIVKLVEPIVAGEADMVTASRFADRRLIPKMPRVKRWGNRWVARIVRLLTGERFHDVSCGFRAFSREALLNMNLFGSFTYTQETFLDLIFKGFRIVEVPVKVRGSREFGTSRIASSIPRYAIRSLQIMLRAFVSYRPFTSFAAVAAVFLAGGFGLLGFLLYHYLTSGSFSPHIWAGFVGGSLVFVGIMTLVIGLIGDIMLRLRLNQEQILYFLKAERYSDRSGGPTGD